MASQLEAMASLAGGNDLTEENLEMLQRSVDRIQKEGQQTDAIYASVDHAARKLQMK